MAFLICLLLIFSLIPAQAEELYQLKISNSKDGAIEVIRDGNMTQIGKVVFPTSRVNPKGFTASKWVSSGEVAATAVNAIHIKVDDGQTIFSIIPNEFLSSVSNYNSYLSPNSSIYCDIEAGQGIFGGGFAPFVGNRVLLNGKKLDRAPAVGDEITILVERPDRWPKYMIFENRFGGKITLTYEDTEEVVGEVLRPAVGVGRFAGSRFVGPGRIRANHPGVIDISTSVGDLVGGFQIIPVEHSQSREMLGTRVMTQWMIVGPTSVGGNTIEGQPPLFKYFLKPQYREDDLLANNWEERLLERFLVDVKYNGQEKWKPMPVLAMYANEGLPAEADTALNKISHIRVLFPQN